MSKFLAASPMLYIPYRRTDDVDFETSMSNHIKKTYNESPAQYASEISVLHRYRQDVRGAGQDAVGRDILYRYHKQLDLLDLRFPINEANVRVLFTWYDAFSNSAISQYSLAYEKASIIFNLGAACCSIGAAQNRYEDAGLKAACKYFQVSAGFFSIINENFLHAPSVDMSRESVRALIELNLAQAQECFIEKVYAEDRSSSLKAKLAAHASYSYSNALELLSHPKIADQFPKQWFAVLKIKSQWMDALSNAEMAKTCESEGKFGAQIAYLQAASGVAKEASKLATQFQTENSNWTPSSLCADNLQANKLKNSTGSGAASALVTNTQAIAARITDELKTAIKDNEFIYHEEVPQKEKLAVIDKLSAVKSLAMADLFPNGEDDLVKVVGPDIFAKLIPMAAHKSASVYSATKDALLRKHSNTVSECDSQVDSVFHETNVLALIDECSGKRASTDIELPLVLKSWHSELAIESSDQSIAALLKFIANSRDSCRAVLDGTSALLEKEQIEFDRARLQHTEQWSQALPSAQLAGQIANLRELKKSLKDASQADELLQSEASKVSAFVQLFSKSDYSAVESVVRAAIRPKEAGQNLLDMPVASEIKSASLDRLREIVDRLRVLKTERRSLLDRMKDIGQNDSVLAALMQKNATESSVFEAELAKYDPSITLLDANYKQHLSLIPELRVQVADLVQSTPQLQELKQSSDNMQRNLATWTMQHQQWKNVRQQLLQGANFYKPVLASCKALDEQARSICESRSRDRERLLNTINAEKARKDQDILQQKLASLQVASAGNAANSSAFMGSSNSYSNYGNMHSAIPSVSSSGNFAPSYSSPPHMLSGNTVIPPTASLSYQGAPLPVYGSSSIATAPPIPPKVRNDAAPVPSGAAGFGLPSFPQDYSAGFPSRVSTSSNQPQNVYPVNLQQPYPATLPYNNNFNGSYPSNYLNTANSSGMFSPPGNFNSNTQAGDTTLMNPFSTNSMHASQTAPFNPYASDKSQQGNT